MNSKGQFLYRGISKKMHEEKRALVPKGTNFYEKILYGEAGLYGSGAVYGGSPEASVIKHQDDSDEFPTAGISTTPFYERAKIYALGKDKTQEGFVYKIDRTLLKKNDIKEWKVSNFIENPKIPEDDEIILVAKDEGILPDKIVIEVLLV